MTKRLKTKRNGFRNTSKCGFIKTLYNRSFLVYFLLSFIVVAQFFNGKYFFLLDLTPVINGHKFIEIFFGKNVPVYGGGLPLDLLHMLIPSYIYQKLILLLILFLSGFSMHKLVSEFTNSKTARFYAGILYMFNPYTYIRIVVGHWGLLFAYSVLPFAIKMFIDMLDIKDFTSIIKTLLVTTLVALSSHMLFIAILVFSIIFLFKFFHERSIGLVKVIFISFVLFFSLDAYWLIPVLVHQNQTVLSKISIVDLVVFPLE